MAKFATNESGAIWWSNFGTNASEAIWWANLQLMQVVPFGGAGGTIWCPNLQPIQVVQLKSISNYSS